MKLRIAAKLFLLLLATSVAVAVVMSVATRMSFKSGFIGYLNSQGVARLEVLAPALQKVYEQNGNWDHFREDNRRWIEFLRTTSRPANTPDLASIHLRMVLLDPARQYVSGYQREVGEGALERPIVVGGKTVGYLMLRSQERMLSAADVQFQQRQLNAVWIIGASVVLLAALFAFMLSRTLVTPLQKITLAQRQLANGNYENRVAIDSNDEIGQLAHDFNALAETLKRNENLRRGFMADIAHELRTPLAVLRGELEGIQDRVISPTPEAIDSLHSEVKTLGKVVEDLYELSLADVGALTYRKISTDIGGVLRTTLDLFTHRFEMMGLKLETKIADVLVVNADPHRIQQLFNNLLENIARYTHSPGNVRIECRSSEDSVVVDFHNSGPGVSTEQLDRLFDRFYRAELSATQTSVGAGLGLAICRKIVEGHAGTISAQRSELGGVLIRLQLPRLDAQGGIA